MNSIKQKVKQKALNLIDLLPFGRDFYISILKDRIGLTYRGYYKDYQSARRPITMYKKNHYDIINSNKVSNIEREKQSLDNWFHDTDYPLLFWLSKLLRENDIVMELGGSAGHFFYSMQKFNPCPKNVKWIIAELPEAVTLGKEIANERQEKKLFFIESKDIHKAEQIDIFMTAGTLQYMSESLEKILIKLKKLPKHVIVHNLPSHKNRNFWTLQNLKQCEVPYQIYSREVLIIKMKSLGYNLIDEWKNDRKIEIPFHRSIKIEGYLGYYFKL